jgi:predicted acylesterase/phospholipase RssA
MRRKALVLSAGGMFGAYQAGAWEVLSQSFQPDIVIGASIGSLNGWAIAAGCDPKELSGRWLRFHENSIRGIHECYHPVLGYGVVVTGLGLKPRLFTTPEVAFEHLKASCGFAAVAGSLYIDGGVLNPLPLWAATQMGAMDILAINVLPQLPGSLLRTSVWFLRGLAPHYPAPADGVKVAVLQPETPLGSMRDALLYKEANARRWLELGRSDAEKLVIG